MFGLRPTVKTEPADGLEQRAADLAARHQELTAHHDERRRLGDLVTQRRAQRERAHVNLSRVLSDPMTFAATSPADLEAAKKSLLDARDAEAQAVEQHAAHERKHPDLAARSETLRRDSVELARDRFRARHRAAAEKKIQLGLEMAALDLEIDQIQREALGRIPEREQVPDGRGGVIERGGGLRDLCWPVGVFVPAAIDIGPHSIWRDHFLTTVAQVHPDLLSLLPEDEAADIRTRAARVPTWYPNAVAWSTVPPFKG